MSTHCKAYLDFIQGIKTSFFMKIIPNIRHTNSRAHAWKEELFSSASYALHTHLCSRTKTRAETKLKAAQNFMTLKQNEII
jgi:hypothetical protein